MPNTLIDILKKKKLTLAVAESASGGYLSYLLTKTPGASKVFKGGVVVYSLDTKNKLLDLPLNKIKKDQGVSENTAAALAYSVRKKLGSDLGASIVGFAGPKGKKTGTTFISLSDKNQTICLQANLTGTRDTVRTKISKLLIELISKKIS
jgi:nicotinamide-nucleotide amidase